jgi:hypothetical protein
MSTQAASHPLPDLPPVGEVPARMLAQVIRQDRRAKAARERG